VISSRAKIKLMPLWAKSVCNGQITRFPMFSLFILSYLKRLLTNEILVEIDFHQSDRLDEKSLSKPALTKR